MAKMTKEEMKGGLNALFGESPQQPQPAPGGDADIIDTLTDEELKEAAQLYRSRHRGRPKKITDPAKFVENYERLTTIVHKEKMAKIRLIALRENLQIKDVMEAMMDEAISTYEAKYGVVRVFPVTGHGDKDNLFKK